MPPSRVEDPAEKIECKAKDNNLQREKRHKAVVALE
jgi:hypothetical protein